MNRITELNKEIAMQIKVTTGKDARNSLHDYDISKMALAVQMEITTRTELQAALISFQSAADQIMEIQTVACQHIVDRYNQIYNDTADYLATVDTDIQLALIDIGRHFHADTSKYFQILADIEIMEHYICSCEILTDAALKKLADFLNDDDLPFTDVDSRWEDEFDSFPDPTEFDPEEWSDELKELFYHTMTK